MRPQGDQLLRLFTLALGSVAARAERHILFSIAIYVSGCAAAAVGHMPPDRAIPWSAAPRGQ